VKSRVILDTGPLVAGLCRRDRYDEWAKAQLADIVPPFLTCESVIAECCFLLERYAEGHRSVLELLRRGFFEVAFHVEDHWESLAKLMGKYANAPMSLADACLVRLSELYPASSVLPTDRHFRTYRRFGRQAIPVLMPSPV